MGSQSHPDTGPFPHGKWGRSLFPARLRHDILWIVRDKTRSSGQSPQKGREKIVKKAILIICVLSVLALLAVPVVAGVLSADSELDRQMAPDSFSRPRGQAEAESPALIAGGGGGFRSRKPQI